jgi:hypothetical protein
VVSVFLNPGIVEPVAPNAQVSVALSDLVITHHGAFSQFTFSGSGHVPGAIDEIRWAMATATSSRDGRPSPGRRSW